MTEVPDSLPPGDLKPQSATDLMNTIQGICNESALKRVEILGALEGVKLCLHANWREEIEPPRE